MWEGGWVDQNGSTSFSVGRFLTCWCPGEYCSRSRPRVCTWLQQMLLLPRPAPRPSSVGNISCHSQSGLRRAVLTFRCFIARGKSSNLYLGMEWAGLSPKCKCHFSTSLVTTPFLAFMGNDIFLCSLSPTHASEGRRLLLYFKRLERKPKRPVRQIPGRTENTNQVTVPPRPCAKWGKRKDCF